MIRFFGLFISAISLSFILAKPYKLLKPNTDLNLVCKEEIVYNMELIDPYLLKSINRLTQDVYSNFLLRKKNQHIGLYEFGCVNDSSITSCSHSIKTKIFFVHNFQVYFYKNDVNKNKISKLLLSWEKDRLITNEEKLSFEEIIHDFILKNSQKKYTL